MTDALTQFKEAILGHGWDPGTIIPDGKIHRFRTNGKRDRSGWYVLHDDPPGGAFGDWREGRTYTWTEKNAEWSDAQRQAFRQRIHQAKAERDEAQAKARAKAAQKARSIWRNAKPARGDHPYLKQKGIRPLGGIRQAGDALVIPVRSLDGEFRSLQFIAPDGSKRFLKDGEVKGCCTWIQGKAKILVCEGWATGASLHLSTGFSVVVAFNAGNIRPMVKALLKRMPNRGIIVCGDDDKWNQT